MNRKSRHFELLPYFLTQILSFQELKYLHKNIYSIRLMSKMILDNWHVNCI